MSGFGQIVGLNVGGGGIPYLTGLVPLPEDFIPNDLHVHLTVGVQGGLIDLSQTKITISGFPVFDGSVPGFDPAFATGSNYQYDSSNNGYVFDIQMPLAKLETMPVVRVTTSTTDGTASDQQYLFRGGPDYPPTPFGSTLSEIPLDRFTGESQDGLLAGSAGLVFISPALIEPQSGSEIDVDSVEARVVVTEQYSAPQRPNPRPFLLGPPPAVPPPSPPAFPPQWSTPDYYPVLNDPNYGLLNTRPQVLGVMFDTISLQTTRILY